MKRYCFIYNPSANRGRSAKKFRQLKQITSSWPDTEYITSESSNHLKSKAREASSYFDVIVACGGDGTVKDVAVSLMHSKANLGIVPLGSGNDFIKTLGLPSGLKESLNVVYGGRSRAIDLGRCNDFYFLNTLGFGFDGETNLHASQSTIRNGMMRYAVAALKTNISLKPFQAEVQIEARQLSEKQWIMLTAANGRVEGGNFLIAPDASVCDGMLNMVTVKPVSRWLLPFLLPLIIIGKHGWLPYIQSYEAKTIVLHFNKAVYIHADGEQIKTGETSFEISVIPSTINVIC